MCGFRDMLVKYGDTVRGVVEAGALGILRWREKCEPGQKKMRCQDLDLLAQDEL